MLSTNIIRAVFLQLPHPLHRMNYMIHRFPPPPALCMGPCCYAAGSVEWGELTQNFNTASVGSTNLGYGTTITGSSLWR